MSTFRLSAAKAGLSALVEKASQGEFVTITRHGKPAAVLLSVEAAEIARKELEALRPSLAAYLRTFPGGALDRNPSPSRNVQL